MENSLPKIPSQRAEAFPVGSPDGIIEAAEEILVIEAMEGMIGASGELAEQAAEVPIEDDDAATDPYA